MVGRARTSKGGGGGGGGLGGVAAAAVSRGLPALSATPEFGPWPYQRAPLPPSAGGDGEEGIGNDDGRTPSVEELNDWAAETMRRIFEEVAGGSGGGT